MLVGENVNLELGQTTGRGSGHHQGGRSGPPALSYRNQSLFGLGQTVPILIPSIGGNVPFHVARVGAFRADGKPVPGVTFYSEAYAKGVSTAVTGSDGTATLMLYMGYTGRTPTWITIKSTPPGYQPIGKTEYPSFIGSTIRFDVSSSDTPSIIGMKLDNVARAQNVPLYIKALVDQPDRALREAEEKRAAAEAEAARLRAEAAVAKTEGERVTKEAAARQADAKAELERGKAEVMRIVAEGSKIPWIPIVGGVVVLGVVTYFLLGSKKTATT